MGVDDWVADLAAGTATHRSGFRLQIQGDPRDPSAVEPGKFPEELSFADQARLLREGLAFIANQAASSTPNTWQTSSRSDDARMAAIRAREEQARQLAERNDKPKRSLLSLKKDKID